MGGAFDQPLGGLSPPAAAALVHRFGTACRSPIARGGLMFEAHVMQSLIIENH